MWLLKLCCYTDKFEYLKGSVYKQIINPLVPRIERCVIATSDSNGLTPCWYCIIIVSQLVHLKYSGASRHAACAVNVLVFIVKCFHYCVMCLLLWISINYWTYRATIDEQWMQVMWPLSLSHQKFSARRSHDTITSTSTLSTKHNLLQVSFLEQNKAWNLRDNFWLL